MMILRVKHRAAVAESPIRSSRRLLSYESVFHAQPVMRERLFVEEMPELLVKGAVLVVPYLNHSVVDAERVAEVFADLMMLDLDDPVVEILAIEQREPLLPIGAALRHSRGRRQRKQHGTGQRQSDQGNCAIHFADVTQCDGCLQATAPVCTLLAGINVCSSRTNHGFLWTNRF